MFRTIANEVSPTYFDIASQTLARFDPGEAANS